MNTRGTDTGNLQRSTGRRSAGTRREKVPLQQLDSPTVRSSRGAGRHAEQLSAPREDEALGQAGALTGMQPFFSDWERFMQGQMTHFAGHEQQLSMPVDVEETDDAINILAECTGAVKSDIDLDLCGDSLVITRKSQESHEDAGEDQGHMIWRERRSYAGQVSRTIPLPEHAAEHRMDATLEDGVLMVRIDKTERAEPGQALALQIH